MDDPDAPGDRPDVHWLLWNVPPGTTEIPEGVPTNRRVGALGDAAQGRNSSGSVGYTGPCPPPDDGAPTYRFTLYPLDERLEPYPGASREELDAAMNGRTIGDTAITGTYDR